MFFVNNLLYIGVRRTQWKVLLKIIHLYILYIMCLSFKKIFFTCYDNGTFLSLENVFYTIRQFILCFG